MSYKKYQNYLNRKSEKFSLSFIDLLFISNFKGGNSTINEAEEIINDKLSVYSQHIKTLDSIINNRGLGSISRNDLDLIIEKVKSICGLTHIDTDTKIDGFSVSYLSALLNAYFIETIPILDRRVLINLKLVSENDLDSQKQIKNIERFYENLIIEMWKLTKQNKKTIREIDKEIFIKKINN